uniref:Magnesium transporter n=1 Tax=Alexandrium monilatum TaxID=311494 RepID=A0A7S4Q285_9DINO|mmetsp:Transcript_92777/g.276769  ORF Transcript_92777/g.276769 Transcript_92777/m.276769 type:complete len:443 (-) Transcript_92777:103-1431(-)|eukprot:CAMPEP_0175236234 /NCGR_PEP_ID=MMETSP0093-20121207/27897_1 /TAXON_ID=311494 /ORGANISM="Alexandrium monilatum, Strain CCMP3105" /LENGTH=442 /DNA_ID=CAMNT_0016530171 /DNA_START=133 /DNA_END=1461 /DNA_ORIENTATION=+
MRRRIGEVDSNRLFPQALRGQGLPPADVEEGRPRLLAGLAFGCDEACGSVRAHIVEADRSEHVHERIRLLDLVKELWPGEGRTESICRRLRSLKDSSKQDFLLRVSSQAVWVRTDFVRALVEPSRVVFLESNSSAFATFLAEFRRRSRSSQREDGFGCWTVECILCAAVTMHGLRLQALREVAGSTLDAVRSQTSDSVLKLYPLKMALSALIERVRPLAQGLRHTLQVEGSELPEECEGRRPREDASPQEARPLLEDVLHSWSRSAEEVMAEAALLSAKIEDTTRFLEASMSCARNRLLMFEFCTNIATVTLGLGSVIAGIFGMNLDDRGMKHIPGMFIPVSAGIGIVMLLTVLACILVVLRSLRHYNDHAPHFGNNRFFRCIAEDHYVLRLSGSQPSAAGPALQNLAQELSEKVLPQQEEFLEGCCRRRHRSADVASSPVI